MICRICLGGPEDSAELGRLISPCKCTGSTRYVHIQCLQTWRLNNENIDNFYRCDICHYEYDLRRVKIASVLLSPVTRTIFTVGLLNIMAFGFGYVAKPLLATMLTDEDIEFILRSPNLLLKQFGVNIRRRIITRDSLAEHHILGTAAIGTIGFFKVSLSYFYSSMFRRRRTLSLILVLIGLIYVMTEIYGYSSRFSRKLLNLFASHIVNDVPRDVPHPEEVRGEEEDVKNK